MYISTATELGQPANNQVSEQGVLKQLLENGLRVNSVINGRGVDISLSPTWPKLPYFTKQIAEAREYWMLPEHERKNITDIVDRVFREATGISRKLDPKNPKDLPWIRTWLRLRDYIMVSRTKSAMQAPEIIRAQFAPSSASSVIPNSKNKFEGCSDPQKNSIEGAFVSALSCVNYAETVLGNAYGRPETIAQITKDMLTRHFHTTDRGDVLEIFRKIFRIRQVLEKGLNIKCMRRCDGNMSTFCGYANPTQWFGGFGPVHLCFDDRPNHCSFANLFQPYQAALIIHETAHRHVGILDKAYFMYSSKYSKLTSTQAMDNADSYAYFCVEMSLRVGRITL